MTLDEVPFGARCRILSVDETSESLLRLMEMGLIPGASVVMERSAPFNSPFSVRLTGCTLAIRREDAELVKVEPLAESTKKP
jgi:Fe2+ transport system protein FeoA